MFFLESEKIAIFKKKGGRFTLFRVSEKQKFSPEFALVRISPVYTKYYDKVLSVVDDDDAFYCRCKYSSLEP